MELNLSSFFSQQKLSLWFRLLLAIVGGFILTVQIIVFVPELFVYIWDDNKANTFLWMMLFSFGLYSGFILWLVSCRRLVTTTGFLILLSLFLYFSTAYLQGIQVELSHTKEEKKW